MIWIQLDLTLRLYSEGHKTLLHSHAPHRFPRWWRSPTGLNRTTVKVWIKYKKKLNSSRCSPSLASSVQHCYHRQVGNLQLYYILVATAKMTKRKASTVSSRANQWFTAAQKTQDNSPLLYEDIKRLLARKAANFTKDNGWFNTLCLWLQVLHTSFCLQFGMSMLFTYKHPNKLPFVWAIYFCMYI